ncbi:unnamed protein product [Porites evermanni]|uniref:G-protein coupled receptors family 1 profile domain-containing protein n=1 Tax=Porites evermanni TaxID=104178 RepID=A0ABN8PRJ2_9CNID|nr:unnamed protein product [Porites evermanni]
MNNTTETTSIVGACSTGINVSALKIGQTIGYNLILVVSLAGNSAIGVIVYKTLSLRKPVNYLIMNMAMSDLILPFITVPWFLVRLNASTAGHWHIGGPLGQALCKLVVYLPMVSYSVSSQSLVLIAVDRFVAVVFPLRSPVIGRKLFPFVITATWIIALAFHSPWFNSTKVDEFNGGSICFTFSGGITSWHIAASIINYIIIVIIIVLLVILYSIIVIKLKLQARPGEQSSNAEKKRARRNRKVLRMACAIVLAFSLCYVPMLTIGFMSLFPKIMSICGFYIFVSFATFMYHVNCAVNPIICLIFSSNSRQGLKRLLKC